MSEQTNPSKEFDIMWRAKFNQLCYEVFYTDKKGQELLKHLEVKFFRSPVAYPNQEPSWAFFNEGQNEMIRSFSVAIQSHINQHNTGQAKHIKGKV